MIPSVYKKEIAQNVGISIRTLQRKLDQFNIDAPRGYICSDLQEEIYTKLGYRHIWEELIKRYLNNSEL